MMSQDVFISSAKRTPVVPRGGVFSALSVHDLCAPLMRALNDVVSVDSVFVGNALYGGGNPARLVALAAGIGEAVPAMTIDTQCCAGMDAVMLAVDAIKVGRSKHAIAGGVESFSRAPIRMHRGLAPDDDHIPYDRPPFSPWADRDPDMLVAAADLASAQNFLRGDQEAFAISSHKKACTAIGEDGFSDEIVPVNGILRDEFTRNLNPKLCQRLPVLAGSGPHAITSATTAVEADAAAFVTLHGSPDGSGQSIKVRDSLSCGGDPAMPGLVPIDAVRMLLARNDLKPGDINSVEIMEAFASQAMAFIDAFQLRSEVVNISGGALARGHPIGASGAVLVVRLVHELRRSAPGSIGLAAIAGAGGLASCLLLERV